MTTDAWHVPFEEVSIRDFRNTHHLDPEEGIHAEIDNFGGAGGDLSEIISWIVDNWDTIYTGVSLLSSSMLASGEIRHLANFSRL